MRKVPGLIAGVVVLAVAVGCARVSPDVVEVVRTVQVEGVVERPPVVEGPAAMPTPTPMVISVSGQALGHIEERAVIWTGDVSLVVKDAEASLEKVETTVKDLGGYVVDSRSWYEGEQVRAHLTVRVPAEKFDKTMALLKDLAIRVESRNIFTHDVTEEYTDLDSRLRNLEATEIELLQLLTEVREQTGKAEDVLAVHRELTNIRGQIERVKGRMLYLENVTAMATIDIELIPDVLARPIVVAGWEPSGTAANALRALVKTAQFLIDAAIWLVIYVLPILVVIAIPLLVLWLIWRRLRRGKKVEK